ncbi:MAG: PTS-dependent dihydroxyacetone kinase phosphotransferase subunit DhaM [Microbacteriaceae bacterium]|nr:PTS-dependent dihydroxyacetone kinase phosphotransferase subunit DhaM [Microbacteriaceae bacterium]
MSVGLVVVSHSDKIAVGIVELARQMAPTTRVLPAGGLDDGAIGTSFEKITEAIALADEGEGAVLLCDLGSAILTAETALDFLDDVQRGRVVIADAPIVEGTVAAAVAAETGGDVAAVVTAAESANRPGRAAPEPAESAEPAGSAETLTARATLVNKDGLHARPAADFVRRASEFGAAITVNGVDAKSLLRIMSLGLGAGSELTLTAEGPDAATALDALVGLIESGFGEA